MSDAIFHNRVLQGQKFAFISVSYPAGSVCTCAMGSKVLKARDTSGSWVFPVPKAGSWTVSCTNGGQSKSQEVNISAKGQLVNVILVYPLYLFKAGGGFQNGYSYAAGERVSYDSGKIHYNNTGSTSVHSHFVFNPRVDVTGYSKLYFDTQTVDTYIYNSPTYLGISTGTGINAENAPAQFNAHVTQPKGGRSTRVLDITGFSGSYYVKVHGCLTTGYVYNCWLE